MSFLRRPVCWFVDHDEIDLGFRQSLCLRCNKHFDHYDWYENETDRQLRLARERLHIS